MRESAPKLRQLEKEATRLAGAHLAARHPGELDWLTDRLQAHEILLQQVYQHFSRLSGQDFKQSYAAEWLLDNYHIVKQAVQEIRKDMPPRYYAQLPKLISATHAGNPRIYDIAVEILALGNGLLQIEEILRFVQAYQQTTVLQIGELWALPVMCRVAVLDSLTGALARVAGFSTAEGVSGAPARGSTEPVSDDTIVANAILSLRTMAAQDWKEIFEDLSRVEQTLRADPSGAYAAMDFDTRDRYRKQVEELALATEQSESDVAFAAIILARGASEEESHREERKSHVGYYLIDAGRGQLENHLGFIPSRSARVRRWLLGRPTLFYLGSVGVIATAFFFALTAFIYDANSARISITYILLLVLVPVVVCATGVVNWSFTHLLSPRFLPKLDFAQGIPPESQTIVVIPAFLTDQDEVSMLLRQLELHFLGNQDPHLSFALLTDFTDAPQEKMELDQTLLDQAVAGIQRLNGRYRWTVGDEVIAPFYLFHRRRQWNASEGIWMGWERKRGKIEEFNRLLCGEDPISYTVRIGDFARLSHVRYVITLDADTLLPRGTAHRLIGTLAHPLNHAKFDERTGEVVAGYAVLQPRIQIKPSGSNQSLFTRIFAGDTGFDLYSRAVSDVYQDLFGQGIYVGKGIYDLYAFQRGLAGRAPQNALLSHDLFEGLHVGVALATDITLVEEYPLSYVVYARRLHRWIRGDWQLLPWLLSQLPYPGRSLRPHRFTIIGRWKILDNLLRSLFPPALLAVLSAAWLGTLGSALLWTLFVFLVSAAPLLTNVASALYRPQRGSMREVLLSLRQPAARWLLMLTFLPYEAILAADAVVRTVFRLTVTRKHLLQWVTAAHTIRLFGKRQTSVAVWREMAAAPFLVAGLTALIAGFHPVVLLPTAPLLGIWFLSPEIAYRISRPLRSEREQLLMGQRYQMRRLARRTWFYFEQFGGPEDQWLPPDHFQESPLGLAAHRTSPTNLGLMLVSTLTAYDLGYIGASTLALRLQPTLETMEKLERYRGHFLNWYDTRTAEPLPPRYISTVDSGNLAACLITLREGCMALQHAPLIRWQHLQGLLDTLDVLNEVADPLKEAAPEAIAPLQAQWDRIRGEVLAVKDHPDHWASLICRLAEEKRPELDRQLMALIEAEAAVLDTQGLNSLRLWIERIHYQLNAARRELTTLAPWLLMLERAPAFTAHLVDSSAAGTWKELKQALPQKPRLDEVEQICQKALENLAHWRASLPGGIAGEPELKAALQWSGRLGEALESASRNAKDILNIYREISRRVDAYVKDMDFRFLFDRQRQLFHIGYQVDAEQADGNYYDLLASEARIASIVAIAKGDVPQTHWLHLARPLSRVNNATCLLSWNGSMFEYLMPSLFMREYANSLLGESARAAVDRQIAYGRKKSTPWGISESGYYQFDHHLNYQYRAFGVPGLGFKRGLEQDLVIAPYASLLALSLRPKTVMDNVDLQISLGMLGNYGLYEAMDYAPAGLPLGKKPAIVRAFYSHHQGMLLLSIANYLLDGIMINRFHSDPRIQSVELLLQEQVPEKALPEEPLSEGVTSDPEARPKIGLTPWPVPVQTPVPQVHFLSNGNYGVLITNAGSGYSQWKEIALTRWRADTTLDNWGTWIYVQDQENGQLWSAGYQPTVTPAQMRQVAFAPDKVEFRTQVKDIGLHLEITVPPVDALEIRRLSITNRSAHTRRLTVTSYGEIVLAPQDVDRRHPAFNKLFIESEYLPELHALLFRRRARSSEEVPVVLIHGLILARGGDVSPVYETDRARFLGRQRTCADPAVFKEEGARFSGTTGATLDPIMALGHEFTLKANETVQLAYYTLAAESRRQALLLAGQYPDWSAMERAFSQIRSKSELELSQLELTTADLKLIQQLLSALLYPNAGLRADPPILASNRKGQPDLWPFSISGDYPILLVSIGREEELSLVRELLRAHTYWRRRGFKIDLVILNAKETGYVQEIQGHLQRLLVQTKSDVWQNRRGGVFILRGDQINEADQLLLKTAARVILDGEKGTLAEQMKGLQIEGPYLPAFVPVPSATEETEATPPLARPTNLSADNGLGGFSPDGREYVIYLEPGRTTPAPWINVIANPFLGFIVSEGGLGSTWSLNSSENRLTPWNNDPVSDTPSEALYLRDEETAEVWSPTPLPATEKAPYLVRHGTGYSIFEHHSHGLKQRVRLSAALEDPIKFIQVRLENTWRRARRVTITYYVDWVLGNHRNVTQQYVISEFNEECQALLARNPYHVEFGERVAFASADRELHGLTGSRTEFLGRLGNLKCPAALARIGLASNTQPGMDPCGAIQVHVDLAPGEVSDICFLMGQGADRQHALELLRHYRPDGRAEAARGKMTAFWDRLLSTLTVETPDPAMNRLLNRWLLYQTLSCRLWARSALYQSSGAYGFRDQLQDVMALLHARPDFAREGILQAARHQFEEGDVLHWWHPPSGRGVRTRISDDLLWLPFVTAHYVMTTDDRSILSETIPFLRAKPLEPEEEERYGRYEPTGEGYSLFEHCVRAVRKASTAGPHGFPLMGAGDWNDGMNKVGIRGQGESVWLGWFLLATLNNFAEICDLQGDHQRAASYRQQAENVRQKLESHAWDGDWYLRAYYDYGVPLGSRRSRECQIDSIAQSWAVLSGAGDPARTAKAMEAVRERLIKPEAQLVKLLAPPFDKTPHDPGYIKGYPPGVRENGGQYTHAALWCVWAFAQLGDGDLAERLFRMLNPIYHSDTPEKMRLYKVEPYVVASDVYSAPPHTGRGGWTWYTGSSGWMYRVGVEAILGVRRAGNRLRIDPCIPRDWKEYRVRYRFGRTFYSIHVQNPDGVNQGVEELTLDGAVLGEKEIPLADDGREHEISVKMGMVDSLIDRLRSAPSPVSG